ncbi:MAG: indoleacetamide hydrolase [Pirellulaceae bacterium]|nr:indoleacetamide hydrolase [Pirellulaceae bacterium]
MDLASLTISEAAAAIRSGTMTASTFAEALLSKAEGSHALNAFIFHDSEQVLRAARVADQARAQNSTLGPLHGIPLALKDNLDTAKMPTTGGTPGLRNNQPRTNAKIVQKLIDAGAIIFGKANLHELAYGVTTNNSYFGTTRNPYDQDRIPGGSSGGVGAAVGARLVPGGIGTDTGGSIRIPSALCGVVGFRPTTGRWSQQGILPVSHTRDTAGPMTRSVADCALLDSVVTGIPTPSIDIPLKGLRLGIPRKHFWEPLEQQTGRLLEHVLERLQEAGVILIEANIDDIARLDFDAGFPIALYETVADLSSYLTTHNLQLNYQQLVAQCASPDVKTMLQSLQGEAAVSGQVYQHAIDVLRPQLQAIYRNYFDQHDVAGIVFPTTPLPASPVGDDETVTFNGERTPTFMTFIRNTSPGSVAGIPGISLPAAQTDTGLPIGLEIDSSVNNDAMLLSIAQAIEHILPRLPAPSC